MIKHISFDLWRTLIRLNPEYSPARLDFLKHRFITKNFSVEEIKTAMQPLYDLNEIYGEHFEEGFTPYQLYFMFIYNLYGTDTPKVIADTNCIEILYLECLEMFKKHPPRLLDDSIPSLLSDLKNKGITLNIASNTSFAGGEYLRTTLVHHDIAQYFDFMIFSDEVNVFKPNQEFFQKIYFEIPHSLFTNEVLHVGDNPYADIKGASDYGFQTLLFTPKSPNYEKIYEYFN